jgi:phage host-nuclease inhibitor protein Gam
MEIRNEVMERLVAGYLERKQKVAEIEARAKSEAAPIKDEMSKIEGALQKLLNAAGATSVKTPAGTAYISTLTSVRVDDWDRVLAFVRERGAWDLLVRNVNKTALADLEEPVPGVSVDQISRVNVRRS